MSFRSLNSLTLNENCIIIQVSRLVGHYIIKQFQIGILVFTILHFRNLMYFLIRTYFPCNNLRIIILCLI